MLFLDNLLQSSIHFDSPSDSSALESLLTSKAILRVPSFLFVLVPLTYCLLLLTVNCFVVSYVPYHNETSSIF